MRSRPCFRTGILDQQLVLIDIRNVYARSDLLRVAGGLRYMALHRNVGTVWLESWRRRDQSDEDANAMDRMVCFTFGGQKYSRSGGCRDDHFYVKQAVKVKTLVDERLSEDGSLLA